MAEENKFLEIVDLKKGYGSGETRQEVLRGMTFSVARGEICVLLGPSGSGKSTLLNIIGYENREIARLYLLCELCLPFVRTGGVFLAMKGPDCAAELDEARSAIRKLGGTDERTARYTIPGTDVTHSVVVIRKTAPTPPKYPRRWAKMQKEHL